MKITEILELNYEKIKFIIQLYLTWLITEKVKKNNFDWGNFITESNLHFIFYLLICWSLFFILLEIVFTSWIQYSKKKAEKFLSSLPKDELQSRLTQNRLNKLFLGASKILKYYDIQIDVIKLIRRKTKRFESETVDWLVIILQILILCKTLEAIIILGSCFILCLICIPYMIKGLYLINKFNDFFSEVFEHLKIQQ